MNNATYRAIVLIIITTALTFVTLSNQAQESYPTLADFWDGRAEWIVDIDNVGLPIGESDTIITETGQYWSYLHASQQSSDVIDQCGLPVTFPGCLTLWTSEDGENFSLELPVCLMTCTTCPCDDQADHIEAQQYPRVVIADDGLWYMVYEWHAQVIVRRSEDGLVWSDWEYLLTPAGTWQSSYAECTETESIGEHPNIRGQADDCILGAPPGLFIEGDTIYVFVMAGSAPAHMRCYKGNRHADLGDLQLCDTDPLFTGAQTYGDIDLLGDDASEFWDFRYISSAEIIQVGDYYYMAYEGIRGPSELEFGRDNQFGLGFARSTQLDGHWETLDRNPVVLGLVDNWGIGHADLLVIDGITYMYSATSQETRGRYVLVWVD
ncbi:MAG: hypothetical protein Phog2KO_29280 [Phototrophicaceae bacterium]